MNERGTLQNKTKKTEYNLKEHAKITVLSSLVERLSLHFLELRSTEPLIRSASHHINENEARRLYKASFDDRLKYRPWFSINDQLDQFYEQCLQNKFRPWNVHYFLAQRLTEQESIVSKAEFKRKKDLLFSKRYKKAKKKNEAKLRKFDEMASKRIWNDQILRKKQQVVTQRAIRGLSQSQHQLQQNKDNALQFPEFLDHQLFHGSRITISWNFPRKRQNLCDQINQFMQNIWPSQTPYEMHLELLRRSKIAKLKAHQNIMTDINQQLQSKRTDSLIP